jgi:4-amino-4-deoxy-L-arabinose transferase-like glycosyltransferase
MTAQHVLLSNVDVRAEPYLMAFIIGSIYHIARLHQRFTAKHLLLAALLTACAIMTKGIFVIVAIYGSLLGQLILQKQFLQLLRLKWWLLLLLTFIFTLPEFYALYIQFDIHPEKTVFGRHNVSGIRWFLWDSQFGRFANNGPIQHTPGSKFFFLHTLLWAFAPWCLLFYFAVAKNLQSVWQKVKLAEYYSLSGGLLLLILFSLSGFQLPFYTNILFPLFAIITAPFCIAGLNRTGNIIRKLSLLAYAILLPIVIIALHVYFKPTGNLLLIIGAAVFGAIVVTVFLKVAQQQHRLFIFTCCAVLFANFYLNTVFFKAVASYNGQIAAAKYVNQHAAGAPVYSLSMSNNVFQFYCNKPVGFVDADAFNDFKTTNGAIYYVNRQTMDALVQSHASFKVIKAFVNYPHENILPAFINSATRYKVLNQVYLISK